LERATAAATSVTAVRGRSLGPADRSELLPERARGLALGAQLADRPVRLGQRLPQLLQGVLLGLIPLVREHAQPLVTPPPADEPGVEGEEQQHQNTEHREHVILAHSHHAARFAPAA
jgi:hypothetical protein